MIGLATIAACCLLAIISVSKRTELVEEADGLELSAYLSQGQITEFKKLRDTQASVEAEIISLEKREKQMAPEDTKVREHIFFCSLTINPRVFCLDYMRYNIFNILERTKHIFTHSYLFFDAFSLHSLPCFSSPAHCTYFCGRA